MKKKVIGFIILLLVFLLGLSVSSYAANNTLYQLNIDSTVDKEDLFDAIFEHYNFTYTGINSTTETNLNSWKSQAFNSDFNCFSYTYNPNNSYNWQYSLEVGYCSGVLNNRITSTSSSISLSNIQFNSAKKFVIPKNAINSSLYQNVGTYTLSTLTTWTYILVQNSAGTWYEYSSDGWSVGDALGPNVEFELFGDGNINVDFNGSSEVFHKYKRSRSVNSWLIGNLEADDDVLVQFTLSRFINDEYSVSIGGAEKKGSYINNYGLAFSSDGGLYVNNANVYYNQGYVLSMSVDGEFKEDWLLYFVNFNYTGSSGELISPDVDTNKDLELLQTLDELSNPSEVPTIYDNTFDKPSGELYTLLGYNDYDNPYGGWIDGLLTELKNALVGSSDLSFSFNLMKHNFTLHSSDFITPDGPIKTFVSGFLVFGFLFYIYKQMAHLYHKLQEGNSLAAVNTVSVDDESVLM